ncbi:low temperature requirement protein A [uncultured Friedmanniella sp.]|uniref:low temperature requirement protein A n=1 Tax=uncultured Friedmanniella sp. TaxID=335381 RepID=UPI0035CC41B9
MSSRRPLAGFRTSRLLTTETAQEGDRVTTLELLFDLVYVFAFTQITELMVHGHSAEAVLQGMAVLGMLWWSWVSYTWLANQAHADRGLTRIAVVVAMAAMFVVSLVIPETFEDLEGGLHAPAVFVVAFELVVLTHATVYVVAAGADAGLRRQVVRTMGLASVPVAVLLVVGAVIGGHAQTWLWFAAVLVEGVLVFVTSHGGDWRVNSMAHFSERHGLIVILALGESIVAIGVGVAELPIDIPILLGSLLAVGLAVGLWWNYFHHLAPRAEHALNARTGVDRVNAATDVYTYLHLPLVAGVLIVALGVELAMHEVGSDHRLGGFAATALGGGLALYLVATSVIWGRVAREWSALRLGGAVLALVLVPVMALGPALVALAVVTALAVGVGLAEGGLRSAALARQAAAPAG